MLSSQKEDIETKKESLDLLIDKIVENSVVVDEGGDTDSLGSALKEVIYQFVTPLNRFLFGWISKRKVVILTELMSIAQNLKKNDDEAIKEFGIYVENICYQYVTFSASIKGGYRDTYKDITSAIMAYRSNIEWIERGRSADPSEARKRSIIDRLKK